MLAGANVDFSASQVHRLIESGSPFGVRKALTRLADAGLVLSSSHGGSTVWRGNRDHVLWPTIELAVDARRELLERLRRPFADRSELSAYVYGSFARRESTPDSDIDVLVIYPDNTTHDTIVDFAHDLSEQIMAWTGNRGQVFNATRSWLRDSIERADPVVMSIREDAVSLVGPEFEQLIRAVGVERGVRG